MNEQKYRIPIGGRWELQDLYQFPHTYTQIYSVLYIFQHELSNARLERRQHIFSAYPWGGGYSAVNWYSGLYYTIPRDKRPQVLAITYASPGWIDLGVILAVAVAIKQMLIAFSEAGKHLHDTYNQIQKGIHQRKLNTIKLKKAELELETERVKFVRKASEDLAKLIGFKNLREMHELTGNPLITLKMLCSIYLRLRILNEFESEGKTKIGESQDTSRPSPEEHRPNRKFDLEDE
jgi:hypothetical protein